MSLEQFLHEVYGGRDITLSELAIASQVYYEELEESHLLEVAFYEYDLDHKEVA